MTRNETGTFLLIIIVAWLIGLASTACGERYDGPSVRCVEDRAVSDSSGELSFAPDDDTDGGSDAHLCNDPPPTRVLTAP